VTGEFVLPPGASNGNDGWKANGSAVAKAATVGALN
jgi:hypothetical protein